MHASGVHEYQGILNEDVSVETGPEDVRVQGLTVDGVVPMRAALDEEREGEVVGSDSGGDHPRVERDGVAARSGGGKVVGVSSDDGVVIEEGR